MGRAACLIAVLVVACADAPRAPVEHGVGFAADADAATKLYAHACALGSAAGCGDLGRVTIDGDETRAVALLAAACRAQHGPSCYALGLRGSSDRARRVRF